MIDSSFITLMALVLAVILSAIYLARRGETMSWLERVGLVGLAVYFPFVLGLTLGGIPIEGGAISPTEWRRWANLIPFGTIGPQLAAGLESGLRQLVGNLLILLPLGFGLPVVWQRFRRLVPTLLGGFGVALGVEISQFIISLIVGVPSTPQEPSSDGSSGGSPSAGCNGQTGRRDIGASSLSEQGSPARDQHSWADNEQFGRCALSARLARAAD